MELNRRIQPSSSAQGRYRAFIKRLATLSQPLFLMGGLAEDALLFHRIVGQHADLDLLVIRHQLRESLQQLKALGLVAPAAEFNEAARSPLVISTGADRPQIELWVSTLEPNGEFSFDVEGQLPTTRFRIFLPVDTFHYPATTIDGVPIQTVSPLALYQLRAISAMTRSVGEKQAKDLAMQARLRQSFLADQDEQKLMPRFVKL